MISLNGIGAEEAGMSPQSRARTRNVRIVVLCVCLAVGVHWAAFFYLFGKEKALAVDVFQSQQRTKLYSYEEVLETIREQTGGLFMGFMESHLRNQEKTIAPAVAQRREILAGTVNILGYGNFILYFEDRPAIVSGFLSDRYENMGSWFKPRDEELDRRLKEYAVTSSAEGLASSETIVVEGRELLLAAHRFRLAENYATVLFYEDSREILSALGYYTRVKFVGGMSIILTVLAVVLAVILLGGIRREVHTHQKLARARLEAQFKSLFMDSPVSIIIHDKDTGRILDANPAAVAEYGYYSLEELIKAGGVWLEPPYSFENARAWIRKAAAEGYQQLEWQSRTRTGEPLWEEVHLSRVKLGDSEAVLATSINITERKRAEDELSRALAAKSDFLSMVSHELRSPLAPILNYSELLLAGKYCPLTGKASTALGIIRRRAEDLARLIDDLLQLTRMDSGVLEMDPIPVSAVELVRGLAAEYEAGAYGKPVPIAVEAGECMVFADPRRLRQALHNLVGNAVKYSDASVAITMGIGVSDAMGVIWIRDNGIGIAPEHLSRVFDRFYQVEGGDTRSRGGSGLGLAIARDMIQLMGGRLGVESEPGRGSTFRVELPLARPSSAASEPAAGAPGPAPGTAGDRALVLIVDDDEDMLELVRELIEDRCEVRTAPGGGRGLELLKQERFDLMLLDWMMPGMDGLSLLEALKANPDVHAPPVIFISGKADPESMSRAVDAGAADFITKPFTQQTLIERMERVLARSGKGRQIAPEHLG